MKGWHAFALLLGASLLCSLPAQAIDPAQVMDGIRDKGTDWLKDKAKEAGEDWIFDTGQSETMHAILDASRDAANGTGNDEAGRCKGAVMGLASTVLTNIGYSWTVKTAGKLAFDTLTKIGGLAAGGLGAAAEGGGLAWLAGQYADAAKGMAKDTALDAIRKAFGKEKAPEYELYETSGTVGSGPCTYTLRAVWDIVNGNYSVYIAGDCHCAKVGNVGVEPRPLGKWWITFEGSMLMKIDQGKGGVTFEPQPPKLDFDAQCGCGKGELRRPFSSKKIVETPGTTGAQPSGPGTTPHAGGATSPGTPGTSTTPPPPPIPRKGRTVCADCQKLQDQIDADWGALDDANSAFNDALNQVRDAQVRLGSDQGQLDAVKANPKEYDITEAKVQAKIDADKAQIAEAKAKADKAAAERARLESELRALGVNLEDCIRKCGHSSAQRQLKNTLFTIGIDAALHPHHKKDDRSDEVKQKDDQQVDYPPRDHSPIH